MRLTADPEPRLKPRLLFFQQQCSERLPEFLLLHKREHVKCLAEFFEVIVVRDACDYARICEMYQPDVSLFESGFPFATSKRLQITNTRAHPQVPKLGFLHSDAFCKGRAGFLSDMDHWDISTFFGVSVTAGEHTPAIRDQLYVWPNFIDSDIYRDYGQWKNIPVLFTGHSGSLYPWRQKMIRLISKRYPSLLCPHPGHGAHSQHAQVIAGERYARMLNASSFVPACGSVANEIVRKHFEVPACRACLATEKSPGLEAAGFVDMENCIFVDEHDVLDKLAYLFGHQERLDAITEAGYQLVHARHTLRHRNQIRQWFDLQKDLQPHQQIVQPGPFEPLRAVDRRQARQYAYINSDALDLMLLSRGDEAFRQGRYDEAERLYSRCAAFIPWMPEPKLRLALCALHKGEAKLALARITEPIQFTLAEYKAPDPDPVEWAYFIISLLCLAKLEEAAMRSTEFEWLRHPELDRTRWITSRLIDNTSTAPLRESDAATSRRSVHQLADRDLDDWLNQLSIMLNACGQTRLAETVKSAGSRQTLAVASEQTNSAVPVQEDTTIAAASKSTTHRRMLFARRTALDYFRRRLLRDRAARTSVKAIKQPLKYVLHQLESKCGYFLPYRISEAKNDAFLAVVRELARTEAIDKILIVGAASGEGSTEALLTGARENNRQPAVFCVASPQNQSAAALSASSVYASANWYRLPSRSPEDSREPLQILLDEIRTKHAITSFDMIMLSDSELLTNPLSVTPIVDTARFVLLDGILTSQRYSLYSRLLSNQNYALLAHDAVLRNGYAVFETLPLCDSVGKRKIAASTAT